MFNNYFVNVGGNIDKSIPRTRKSLLFLLKILCKYIAVPLSKIVNQSFETGIFPVFLKIGKVNPVHKKNSCNNPSNYRPIAILSVLFLKFLRR